MVQQPADLAQLAIAQPLAITRAGKDLQPRAPVVVSGPGAVEAKYLRPRAEQRGSVVKARAGVIQQRPDNLGIELAGQLQAADERRGQLPSICGGGLAPGPS